jgi:acyl-CoA synthetase (AMP-forming)/AMP-acid ligase II
MNLCQFLSQSAARSPGSIALVEGQRAVNYRDLLRTVEATAVHLSDGGVCAGEPVAIQMPNSIECVAAVKSAAGAESYVGDAEASAIVFRNGYVLIGDIGCMDDAGHLFVLGRKRQMLNVAGKKVAPYEVEACLRTHPSVGDVLVVGAATAHGDERAKAFVVPVGTSHPWNCRISVGSGWLTSRCRARWCS